MEKEAERILEARSLGFSYTDDRGDLIPALTGVDLTVRKGEHLALIGPNGSGKTTLLKLLNALLAPSTGEVLVEGISTLDPERIVMIRKACGMIFQNPDNQLVATTVEEDMAFGLENQALPAAEIRKRIDETAGLLGLTHLLKHPPHLLSGGEKQRVAIAGVLVMQPQCLLMDEPTAMLDPAGRRDVLNTVQMLNKKHKLAVIHVTHYAEEAACADRIIVLNSGRIVNDGPRDEILTNLEMLHDLGLRGTEATELAALLRQDGLDLPEPIISSRELVERLCTLERKN